MYIQYPQTFVLLTFRGSGPRGRSGKCIGDLLKYRFACLTMFDFVQVNKSNTGRKYKVIFDQIPNTEESKEISAFDGVTKNKCMMDIICTLDIYLQSTR